MTVMHIYDVGVTVTQLCSVLNVVWKKNLEKIYRFC